MIEKSLEQCKFTKTLFIAILTLKGFLPAKRADRNDKNKKNKHNQTSNIPQTLVIKKSNISFLSFPK